MADAASSVFQQAKDLETQIGTIVSGYDADSLPLAARELLNDIKHSVIDIRLDARDYEYAETRDDQLLLALENKERLEYLQQRIVKASEYNIFTAVDVAQLSARIQQLMTRIV